MTPLLIEDLKRDEGLRLVAYRDTAGVWTIGYGHAHAPADAVWTQARAQAQLVLDIDVAVAALDETLSWWRTLDDVRQDVLVELAFNMGIGRLMGFHQTLASMRTGAWAMASAEMLLSDWAGEVGDRAQRLAAMMRSGARPAPPARS